MRTFIALAVCAALGCGLLGSVHADEGPEFGAPNLRLGQRARPAGIPGSFRTDRHDAGTDSGGTLGAESRKYSGT